MKCEFIRAEKELAGLYGWWIDPWQCGEARAMLVAVLGQSQYYVLIPYIHEIAQVIERSLS